MGLGGRGLGRGLGLGGLGLGGGLGRGGRGLGGLGLVVGAGPSPFTLPLSVTTAMDPAFWVTVLPSPLMTMEADVDAAAPPLPADALDVTSGAMTGPTSGKPAFPPSAGSLAGGGLGFPNRLSKKPSIFRWSLGDAFVGVAARTARATTAIRVGRRMVVSERVAKHASEKLLDATPPRGQKYVAASYGSCTNASGYGVARRQDALVRVYIRLSYVFWRVNGKHGAPSIASPK